MKEYIITQGQLNSILGYLAKQPYQEVFEAIIGLQSLPVLEKKEEVKNDKQKSISK